MIYSRKETRFVEEKKAKFDVGLNCTTLQSNLTGLSRWRIQFNPGIAAWSLDHSVRSRQHIRRNRESDLLGGF